MQGRPTWQLFGLAGLVGWLIVIAVARYLIMHATIADPVRVLCPGLPVELEEKVRVFFVLGEERTTLNRVGKIPAWEVNGTWIDGLVLQLPEERIPLLERVQVVLGRDEFVFSAAEVRQWPRTPPHVYSKRFPKGTVFLSIPDVFRRTSSAPAIGTVPWNWPGDRVYLGAVAKYSFTPLLLLGLVCFFLYRSQSASGRTWCRQILGLECRLGFQPDTPDGQAGSLTYKRGRSWNCLGLACLAAALIFLEVRTPYYFTQDDNMVDALPVILVGCRSLWQGEFPNYNPYLFLGSPLANLGLYSMTYPPLHVSYAVARHLLGNDNATLEVFAILHLVIGFFSTRTLGSKLGMGGLVRNLVALSLVLSGPALIMGRSWFNFTPLFAWLPLFFVGLVRLQEGPVTWKWLIGMGVLAALPFHVGFSQIAVYFNSSLCLAAAYLVLTGNLPWRRASCLVPALLLGAGLSLPIVYQQLQFASQVNRFEAVAQGVGLGMPGFLLPYPLVQLRAPTGWGNLHPELMGHLYFSGGILAWLCVLEVAGLAVFRPGKHELGGLVWIFGVLVTFLLALGDAGGLWKLATWLPVVGFINRYPMRLLPFLIFFLCIAGGLVLEQILRTWSRTGRIVLAGAALALIALHVVNCRTAFYSYNFTPYPLLPEPLRDRFWTQGQLTGRICSWGRVRSFAADYALFMPNNLPAAYGLPSMDGYNALLESAPAVKRMYDKVQSDPMPAMREYGVRWQLLHAEGKAPKVSSYVSLSWGLEMITINDLLMQQIAPQKYSQVFPTNTNEASGLVVTELPGAAALAFPLGRPDVSLPVHLHGWGIEVDVPPQPDQQFVVVNFLRIPGMQASVDGEPVPFVLDAGLPPSGAAAVMGMLASVQGPLPAMATLGDSWNRVLVPVPAGGKHLAIRYSPPWRRGILVGLGLMIAAAAMAFACRGQKSEVSEPPA